MKRIDLQKRTFGRLTVLDYLKTGRDGRAIWICKCSCGNTTNCSSQNLLSTNTKSCGCLRRDVCRNNALSLPSKFINLSGKNFNRLTVLNLEYQKKKHYYWKCRCICGKNTIVPSTHLRSGHTQSCGCFLSESSSSRKGKKSSSYLHYLTTEDRINKRDRKYFPSREWRRYVFKRDNYICQITGKQGKICAHHLNSWMDFPDSRFEISNGITLLQSIHKLFHKTYGYRNNTDKQFKEFKLKYNYGDFINEKKKNSLA